MLTRRQQEQSRDSKQKHNQESMVSFVTSRGRILLQSAKKIIGTSIRLSHKNDTGKDGEKDIVVYTFVSCGHSRQLQGYLLGGVLACT